MANRQSPIAAYPLLSLLTGPIPPFKLAPGSLFPCHSERRRVVSMKLRGRVSYIALALVMAFGLTACAKKVPPPAPPPPAPARPPRRGPPPPGAPPRPATGPGARTGPAAGTDRGRRIRPEDG